MGEWYEHWFNTKFYHILYKNRDEQEARDFLQRLIKVVPVVKSDKILDLACGNGRHAHYLSSLGFQVVGADLSSRNIEEARENQVSTAEFVVHDMRNVLEKNTFDIVLNLFTSFGYFQDQNDQLKSMRSIAQSVNNQGKVVIDFFNSELLKNLEPCTETKKIDELTFKIQKQVEDNKICKRISVVDNRQVHDYEEIVQLLNLNDFERLFDESGLRLYDVYGSYQFEPYDQYSSDRLILIAEKR